MQGELNLIKLAKKFISNPNQKNEREVVHAPN